MRGANGRGVEALRGETLSEPLKRAIAAPSLFRRILAGALRRAHRDGQLPRGRASARAGSEGVIDLCTWYPNNPEPTDEEEFVPAGALRPSHNEKIGRPTPMSRATALRTATGDAANAPFGALPHGNASAGARGGAGVPRRLGQRVSRRRRVQAASNEGLLARAIGSRSVGRPRWWRSSGTFLGSDG